MEQVFGFKAYSSGGSAVVIVFLTASFLDRPTDSSDDLMCILLGLSIGRLQMYTRFVVAWG